MKKYLVGGAVRDELLGKEPKDYDYVVVGSSIDEMLLNGYKQVGKEFPVFLDNNGNEIALARKDYKIGDKHTDFKFEFSPNVTLDEDLKRRDITINSMAKDLETGEIIDPYGGQESLRKRLLEITDKEHFDEDPLRILRVARQSAQLDFDATNETIEIMSNMVKNGMLNHLTPERVWKETEKALSKGYNSKKYFEVLNECGALEVLFPELYALTKSKEQIKYHNSGNSYKHTMIALDRVKDEDLMIKFATCVHDLGKGNTPEDILPKHSGHDERGVKLIDEMCDRIKIPNKYREFAKLFCKEHMRIAKLIDMKLSKQYDIIYEISDKFKDEEKMEAFLKCFYADFFGEEILSEYSNPKFYDEICTQIRKIFNTMHNITIKDLDSSVINSLSRSKGEKFGLIYRESMINYLRQRINKTID